MIPSDGAFRRALDREVDRAIEYLNLTEVPCIICGLDRLRDVRDHHVCRRDPQHEFTGLRGFVTNGVWDEDDHFLDWGAS